MARWEPQSFCWHCFSRDKAKDSAFSFRGEASCAWGGKSLACKRLNKMLLIKLTSLLNLGWWMPSRPRIFFGLGPVAFTFDWDLDVFLFPLIQSLHTQYFCLWRDEIGSWRLGGALLIMVGKDGYFRVVFLGTSCMLCDVFIEHYFIGHHSRGAFLSPAFPLTLLCPSPCTFLPVNLNSFLWAIFKDKFILGP